MIISVNIDVDSALFYGLIFTVTLLIFYVCFDLNYFLTNMFLITWCKIRRKRVKIDETTEYYGVCTTNDLDIYFQHMNNARYIRELDFARFHFYQRTGIYEILLKSDGLVLQTACHVRYRRTIPFLTPYKITTKVIYWDEKNIYLEHQFVTLSDGFITTVILCKQAILGVNVIEMMNKLLEQKNDENYKPEPPPELEDWIHLNKKSSARLRNGNRCGNF
ncbi:protein THEM6 [Tribolium castaneum]|uniref:Protein THEM6 n=1 Tax=Tribolium castaneum TaxID=7070 RepID=D7EIA0_TRICA|nr:PREDICTED: protein THEM6 [Tribolium castaneum]EFA11753.1 Protein THEM6-like Protein [Tribolium castaneum]|eukprot:XP_969225.3 PREDICTED: protein THEM6 [Tribolium castaneum]